MESRRLGHCLWILDLREQDPLHALQIADRAGAGGSAVSELASAKREAIAEALSQGRGEGLTWHSTDESAAVLFAGHRGLKACVETQVKEAYTVARALARDNRMAVEAIAVHLTVDGHLEPLSAALQIIRSTKFRD